MLAMLQRIASSFPRRPRRSNAFLRIFVPIFIAGLFIPTVEFFQNKTSWGVGSVSAFAQNVEQQDSSAQLQRIAEQLNSVGCQAAINPFGSAGLLVNVTSVEESLAKTVEILKHFPHPLYLSLAPPQNPLSIKAIDVDFSELCELRILHFSIGGVKLKPSQVQNIGRMRNLNILKVQNCPGFNDEGLRFLNQLKSLELSGSDVTDAGLETVPTVQFLDFAGDRVTGVGLSKLQDLYKLTLRSSATTNDGLGAIGSLPKLETLFLTLGEHVDTDGLVRLSRSPHLRNLNLEISKEIKVVGQELRRPNQFQQLWYLTITSSASNEMVCELVAGLSRVGSSSLDSLILNCPNMDDEVFRHLGDYRKNPHVTISPCRVTESSVMSFTQSYQGRVTLFRGQDLTGFAHGKRIEKLKRNPYEAELRKMESRIQELHNQGKSPSPGQILELNMLRRGEQSGK